MLILVAGEPIFSGLSNNNCRRPSTPNPSANLVGSEG